MRTKLPSANLPLLITLRVIVTSLLLAIPTSAQVTTTRPSAPQGPSPIFSGVPGRADITVLVVVDKTTPLAGAVVTLQGTDPGSLAGLTGTTAASGRVTFPGVAGPYTITAQKDFTHSGTTTRQAVSLIEVTPVVTGFPPAGTIGVPLDADFEGPPLSADATLQGFVTNRPTNLPSDEGLFVVAESRSGDYSWGSWVDSSTGAYSIPIPSGVEVDCNVTHRKSGYGPFEPSWAVLGMLLRPGVGQATPGGQIDRDFDFGSSDLIPWDQSVPISTWYLHPGHSNFGLQLVLEDRNTGVEFDFSFHDGGSALSFIDLPNLSNGAFTPYEVSLGAEADIPSDSWQERSMLLTATPSAVVFDFFLPPSILQPMDMATLTMQEFDNLHLQITETATGSFGTNGINGFALSTRGGFNGVPPPGIDEASWEILLRPGVTSFDLPPHALPLFAPSQLVSCEVWQWRQLGYAFDYDTFFDGDILSNLVALEGNSTDDCDGGSAEVRFFLYP